MKHFPTSSLSAEFQALDTFFGGVTATVYSEIILSIHGDRHMASTLSFIDTTCVDIPDGTETYIIRRGQIVALTTHGFFVFSC